uniref:Thioredoxin domain-containing protein n=1 Tax=Chryseobacterium endophyticum TaxID=1854762 RepID=A0AAU6WM94_9FLAO
MKKIILSTLVLFALASCKKESRAAGENSGSTDSTAVSQKTEAPKVDLKEISQQELVSHLSTKNDTLYVTNFFATWCGPCMMEIPHFKKKLKN